MFIKSTLDFSEATARPGDPPYLSKVRDSEGGYAEFEVFVSIVVIITTHGD